MKDKKDINMLFSLHASGSPLYALCPSLHAHCPLLFILKNIREIGETRLPC
jgi:hypothetical protein